MATREEDLTPFGKGLYAKIDDLHERISEKDRLIDKLQKKVQLQEKKIHYLSTRVADLVQAEKEARPEHMVQVIEDLQLINNQLMETVERLEKEKKEKKGWSKWIPSFLKYN